LGIPTSGPDRYSKHFFKISSKLYHYIGYNQVHWKLDFFLYRSIGELGTLIRQSFEKKILKDEQNLKFSKIYCSKLWRGRVPQSYMSLWGKNSSFRACLFEPGLGLSSWSFWGKSGLNTDLNHWSVFQKHFFAAKKNHLEYRPVVQIGIPFQFFGQNSF